MASTKRDHVNAVAKLHFSPIVPFGPAVFIYIYEFRFVCSLYTYDTYDDYVYNVRGHRIFSAHARVLWRVIICSTRSALHKHTYIPSPHWYICRGFTGVTFILFIYPNARARHLYICVCVDESFIVIICSDCVPEWCACK